MVPRASTLGGQVEGPVVWLVVEVKVEWVGYAHFVELALDGTMSY